MTTELCPECGCRIGPDAYESEGVTYCCEACAQGGTCECGCHEEDTNPERPTG